jgi:hypothetical protein
MSTYEDPITDILYRRMSEYFRSDYGTWRLNLGDLTTVVKGILADDLEQRAKDYQGAAEVYAKRSDDLIRAGEQGMADRAAGKAIVLEQEAYALKLRAQKLKDGKL